MRTHTARACSHALTTHAYTCARAPVHTQHVHTYTPNTEMGSLLARSFAARFLQVTLQGRPGRLPLCRGRGLRSAPRGCCVSTRCPGRPHPARPRLVTQRSAAFPRQLWVFPLLDHFMAQQIRGERLFSLKATSQSRGDCWLPSRPWGTWVATRRGQVRPGSPCSRAARRARATSGLPAAQRLRALHAPGCWVLGAKPQCGGLSRVAVGVHRGHVTLVSAGACVTVCVCVCVCGGHTYAFGK